MLTQTVALTSVCSDSLESAFPFPTSDGTLCLLPSGVGSRALVGTQDSRPSSVGEDSWRQNAAVSVLP